MKTINTDALIIGRGPAGVQAALYIARAGFKPSIAGYGAGSLGSAETVENFYGQTSPVSGADLQKTGEAQARSFGAEIYDCQVTGFEYADDGAYKALTTAGAFITNVILIATGAKREKIPVKGVDAFTGRGVSYCAVCDGFLYRGKKTGVLGFGQYAFSEARELAGQGGFVTIFTNGHKPNFSAPSFGTPSFGAPGGLDNGAPGGLDETAYEVVDEPVEGLVGDGQDGRGGAGSLTGVRLRSGIVRAVDGLFIAYGMAGGSDLARKLGVNINLRGDILTDGDQATNVPGVYAAGDCTGVFRQIAVAVGQGAIAARSMIEYLRKNRPRQLVDS